MFETGRWRRFHTEQGFLENIREAKAAVETWRDLMARDAAPAHLDLSGKHLIAKHDETRDQVALLVSEPETMVDEPLREIPDDVLAALESHLLDMDAMPSVSDAPDLDDMPLPPLDLDSIQRRYPLLHNAL